MKTTNLSTRFALALSLLGALAATAHAESFSVKVPFAFVASGKNFPAGIYFVEPIGTGFLSIQGAKGADSAAIAVSPQGYTDPSTPSLTFDSAPNAATLSSIRMDSGMTFTVLAAKHLASASAVPAKGTVALSHP